MLLYLLNGTAISDFSATVDAAAAAAVGGQWCSGDCLKCCSSDENQ